MIEAKVHAPNAALVERAVVYGVASALVLAGLVATNAFPIAPTLLVAGFWIWLVSPALLRRRKWNVATVEPAAGEIRIRGGISGPRVISTRSLVGASVARSGDRAVVTLSQAGSRAPWAIEVSTVEAADRIRSALGIPHGGFGIISWTLQPWGIDYLVAYSRIAAAALLAFGVSLGAVGAVTASPVFTLLATLTSVTAVIGAAALWFAPHRVLRMSAPGIEITGPDPLRAAFSEISEIVDDKSALLLRRKELGSELVAPCASTWLASGLSDDERALMIAQLRGALAAANGEVAPFVDPTSHLDQLLRRDAPASEWLARIDALAALQNDAAYRGAALAKEDLWRALESHDAAPDLRAGAARVLLRISPEKEHDRIADAIDSIHDDDERAHIRAALEEDIEKAAADLEAVQREPGDSRERR